MPVWQTGRCSSAGHHLPGADTSELVKPAGPPVPAAQGAYIQKGAVVSCPPIVRPKI